MTYCDDGVLEYLIVTHADEDHIKELVLAGGLFDTVLENRKKVKEESSSEVYDSTAYENVEHPLLRKIENIIDFDSYRVRLNSSDPDKPLINTDVYRTYQRKRDAIIKECESRYAPAAYFFNEVTGDTTKEEFHNFAAMPIDYLNNCYSDKGLRVNFKTYPTSKKNIHLKRGTKEENYNFIEDGSLKAIGKQEEKRYTDDIAIGRNVSLRLLYNWYYDSYYSTNENYGRWSDNQTGQPQNNISVCFMVESETGAFLSFGDLGSYGEDGLLRYYSGTDIFSKVRCFKASHHGSTQHRAIAKNSTCSRSENSKKLFDVICSKEKTLKLVVTGVAQPSRDNFEKGDTSVLYAKLDRKPLMTKELFDNFQGYSVNVYCTQILRTEKEKTSYGGQTDVVTNQPFYGDVHAIFRRKDCEIRHSYHDSIKTFVKKNKEDGGSAYEFKTDSRPIEKLEWAKLVGLQEE